MATLREQTNKQFAKLQQSKPEFAGQIESLLAKARDFGDGKDAIAVGQPAPNFVLPSAKGEAIELSALLTGGPVVIVFYRGSWCPYCNLQLRAMQDRLADIKKLGGQFVAVSPEVPELILDHMRDDRGLDLTKINDGNGTVLPIPATFVVSTDGVVAWQYVNVDYRHRAEPDDVIAALRKLN